MKSLAAFIFSAIVLFSAKAQDNNYHFLIGTFTSNTPSKGIYMLTLNKTDLSANVKLLSEAPDPSFLCLSNNKKKVYAVSERGAKSSVATYSFKNKQELILLNKVNAGSVTDPCHIALSDKHVVTANYSGGSIFVYKRNPDGTLSETVQKIQHEGKSTHPTRQTKPHTHQVVFSPDGKFLLSNDLGIDKVLVYKYNKNNSDKPFSPFDTLNVKPGSGPRHLTFDQQGSNLYLLQELDGTVSSVKFDKGKLTLIDTTSVVRKPGIQAGAADIHISPDGRFLYATNRGNANDISCFCIMNSGRLEFVEQVSVEGEGPRNFTITNDGKLVLVGNQRSNQISIFNRDAISGKLTFTEKKVNVGAPVCILEY